MSDERMKLGCTPNHECCREIRALCAELERVKGRYEGLGDGADGETVQMIANQREEIRALRAKLAKAEEALEKLNAWAIGNGDDPAEGLTQRALAAIREVKND